MYLTNRQESMVKKNTFYRYLPIVEKCCEELWKKSIFDICSYMFNNKNNLPEIAGNSKDHS